MPNFQALQRQLQHRPFATLHVVAGLDAFVDNIYQLVAARNDPRNFIRMEKMGELAERIVQASGKSANVEMVLQERKAGGNAPLFAVCSSALGAQVTAIGPVGATGVQPVFQEAGPDVRWVSIGEPGCTDALEFLDGKLMLGNIGEVGFIGWGSIEATIGAESFLNLVRESDLLMLGNWTMLLGMDSVYAQVALGIAGQHPGLVYIDLADPRKRTSEDLLKALRLLAELSQKARVVLGLNRSEAEQVGNALGLCIATEENGPLLEAQARILQKEACLHGIVIHGTKVAAGVSGDDSAWVNGPYCAQPRITTGAGDHFNGGCANALAVGWSMEDSLLCGVYTSGYYVRNGIAPNNFQLADFLA